MKVVYLHGFASGPASRKARFFAERLEAEKVETIVPDLAQGDFENLTISGQLEVVGQAVAEGPAVIVGSSLGGYLAALFAARNPDRIARLLLLAPAFGFAQRWNALLGPDGLERWLATGKLPVYHYAERRMRDLGLAIYEDAKKWEPEPNFGQPALIFHGVNDAVVPVESSREFASHHGNAELIELTSDHELTDVLPEIWRQSQHFLLGA